MHQVEGDAPSLLDEADEPLLDNRDMPTAAKAPAAQRRCLAMYHGSSTARSPVAGATGTSSAGLAARRGSRAFALVTAAAATAAPVRPSPTTIPPSQASFLNPIVGDSAMATQWRHGAHGRLHHAHTQPARDAGAVVSQAGAPATAPVPAVPLSPVPASPAPPAGAPPVDAAAPLHATPTTLCCACLLAPRMTSLEPTLCMPCCGAPMHLKCAFMCFSSRRIRQTWCARVS